MNPESMVIIGGGLAGATAAQTLREEGFTGALTLVGAEPRVPYLRPPLSKEYLHDADPSVLTILDEAWYAEHDVELILGDRAVGLDPAEHRVELKSGRSLTYGRLLLATGSHPRHLRMPGADLDGVHYLRSVRDSDRLRAALAAGGRRLVVVGSGWIGLEVAAAARDLGNDVTMIGLERVALSAVLGERLGAVFQQLHTERGVKFLLPAGSSEITGSDGAATAVVTDTGATLEADLVLIAAGAQPDVRLAQEAGLQVDNGILVDSSLRTSDPDIFAAGDAANLLHPVLGTRLRSEHWANAIAGGKTAARAMAGRDGVQDDIPYFYTDQYDLGMEYSGYPPLAEDAELVIRGSLESREFIALWVLDNRVVAGMNVNIWDVQDDIQELIRSGRHVDRQRLADAAIGLDQV